MRSAGSDSGFRGHCSTAKPPNSSSLSTCAAVYYEYIIIHYNYSHRLHNRE